MKGSKTVDKDQRIKEAESRAEKLGKLSKKINKEERSVKNYQFFILRLAAFLLAMWIIFFVLIGVLHMPTSDMYPRVDAGDFVLYYRLDKDVKAQDVIVLEKDIPGEGKQTYILRVVATAGDTVEITKDDRLKVNGNIMVERNIFYPTPIYSQITEYPLKLEEDQCFVLADSRNGGTDSRYFGPVEKDEILGTVITVIRRNNL